MIRAVPSVLFVLALMAPALGQQAESETAAQPEEAASAPAQEMAFDPEPFLNSMMRLRGAGLTCDPFVGGNPAQRTQGVVSYFDALGQELPDLVNSETQASLRGFIGSQAASLCQIMLDTAFAQYHQRATEYEANRPQEWPPAPAAEPGQWCAEPYCLDR